MSANGLNGAGGGPPKGSAWDSPYAGPETILGGPGNVPPPDPAHPRPGDALAQAGDPTKLIYRQIPNITLAHGWSIDQVRNALRGHNEGIFEASAQLVDSIFGDDRVQATLGSRISGLFGQEVRFKPADESDAARECRDAWASVWPKFATTAALMAMHGYEIMMGFEPAQLLWDTSKPIWAPQMEPWHPRFTYWHWGINRLVALSQDGEIPVTPGDGKWVLHSRYGMRANDRGWVRGAVRAIAQPWIFRHWAIRDLARYTEVHGMPIRKAVVPSAADEPARDRFAAQLATLGQETTIMVQSGADGAGQDYDLELVEAKDTNWQAMIGLRDHCDMAIVLALLFQNLTTEVQGGSFAATRAHMDIRSSGIQADNDAWRLTIYEQVARPFAWLNFGDADLAPWTDWEVQPLSDWDAKANMLSKFGNAIEVLRRGGVQFKSPGALRAFARTMGIKLPPVIFKEPVSGGGLGK